MQEKVIPLEPTLLDNLTKAAIEKNNQGYKDTYYSVEVSERLAAFNVFLNNTQNRIVGLRTEMATILTQLGIDQNLSNNFIRSTALASSADILQVIAAIYPTIPNSYGDKFKLGVTMQELNKCFDPVSLATSYSKTSRVSPKPESSDWTQYIAEQVSSRSKEIFLAV